MKKERRPIDLKKLESCLQATKLENDSKLGFEYEFAIFAVLQVFNINLALHHFAYYNYNFLLLGFNVCFLTRRYMRTRYINVTLEDPLCKSWKYKSIVLVI